MKTKTIFRTFKEGGETIALFPEEAATRDGWDCMSYMHIGRHGGATPDLTRGGWDCPTRPATELEIAPLAKELRKIGYDIKMVKKFSRVAYDVRKCSVI